MGVGLLTAAGGREITKSLVLSLFSRLGLTEAAFEGAELVVLILGPWGMLIGALVALASGAYLLGQTRNKVQGWLIQTEWRRVPEHEEDVPIIWYDAQMEREKYSQLGEEKE